MKIEQVEFNNQTLWVLEGTDLSVFRTITDPEEIKTFTSWTNKDGKIKSIYHPLTQDAMIKDFILKSTK